MKLFKNSTNRIIAVVVSALLFSTSVQVWAQNENPAEAFDNVSKVVIHSAVLGEDRNLFIALPTDYDKEENFPVLYMLDGEMVFPYSEAIETAENTAIGAHIIVGLQTNINRNRDMIPVAIESRPNSGGADVFLKFIIDELKPYIDSKYKTSGFDILYGASNAGLFTLFAMFEQPAIFDAYISSSTMIGHCSEYMYQKIYDLESKDQFKDKMLYVHWGMKDYFKQATEFIPQYYKTLNNELKDYFIFEIKAIKDGGHVPPGGIHDGLSFIYSNR